MLDKTIREPVGGGVGWGKGHLNDIVSMILTSAKNNHIAPDNRTCPVAKTKKKLEGRPEANKNVPTGTKKIKKPGGRAFLHCDEREMAYASEDHDPANRQVDEPTMQRAFLRSAFKAQKPLRSRAKSTVARGRAR